MHVLVFNMDALSQIIIFHLNILFTFVAHKSHFPFVPHLLHLHCYAIPIYSHCSLHFLILKHKFTCQA
ncbi:hypothetical protein AQUCO_02100150v1 [Aquilegia coerulea]|uniref:Uncharacterized protein n=1 Tax=Aquilegia coerulea TaxID=218851 RepID=A0A2G5DEZ0_AQUCA|nr:hypothetical protein AQUCO_02100150v1 [Aquilegia coerulea]